MKKIVIPVCIIAVVMIILLSSIFGSGNSITLKLLDTTPTATPSGSVTLKVYVENSGSMDAYMCPGSTLKDAVFDYISDAKTAADTCRLNYINSEVIPYRGTLDSYIKDLTPASFAKAGGDRSNTDLRQILRTIMKAHRPGDVSVFVSDCILDIPENAVDFFGNCQVSIKNIFNDALKKVPSLGVQILKMESVFSGYWYCGKNIEKLQGVKRPYYIWIIGDAALLAKINKAAPVSDIIHDIKEYCAYTPVKNVPYDIEKKRYVVNRNDMIDVEILADMSTTLQSELTIRNTKCYTSENPAQITVEGIAPITAQGSKYTHVITLNIHGPKTLKGETLTFSYPLMPQWVSASNDDSGRDVSKNLDKTTGIKYLIKGVAEAYKDNAACGSFSFELKNK